MNNNTPKVELVTVDGREFWKRSDYHKLLPRVRGGAVDDGGGSDGGDNNDNDPGKGNAPDPADHWKQQAREWEKRAKGNEAAEKERDDALAKLQQFENESKTQSEKERDKAVREAEERVRKEMSQTANLRLVKAEVRVAAAGKLADPEDAIRFLDLDTFKVDDKTGELDSSEVAKAIDDLVNSKPYLGVTGDGKPRGDIDQGARDKQKPKVEPGTQRLAHAYASSGDKKNT